METALDRQEDHFVFVDKWNSSRKNDSDSNSIDRKDKDYSHHYYYVLYDYNP